LEGLPTENTEITERIAEVCRQTEQRGGRAVIKGRSFLLILFRDFQFFGSPIIRES
jgi:hypothetical protein